MWINWVANALIVVGMILIGRKYRHAFLFSIAGEAVWTATSVLEQKWDLATICAIFVVVAFFNWRRWCREHQLDGKEKAE